MNRARSPGFALRSAAHLHVSTLLVGFFNARKWMPSKALLPEG